MPTEFATITRSWPLSWARGWEEPLDAAATRDALPRAARAYVEFVERALEVPVELVGVGAARERA